MHYYSYSGRNSHLSAHLLCFQPQYIYTERREKKREQEPISYNDEMTIGAIIRLFEFDERFTLTKIHRLELNRTEVN